MFSKEPYIYGKFKEEAMKTTKRKRKILCAALIGGLILGCLTGCGDTKEPGGSVENTTIEQSAAVSSEPQETEAPSVSEEEMVCTGPENKTCTSYVIPEGVTEIKAYAFSGCTGLTNVEIPGIATMIWDYAFSDCSSLTSIKVPEGISFSTKGMDGSVDIIYY